MRFTIMVVLSLLAMAPRPACAQGGLLHYPFHGDQPLGSPSAKAALDHPDRLRIEEAGVLMGKGVPAPIVRIPDWDGRQGTVAFWVKSVDWDPTTKEHVVFIKPVDPKEGGFLVYKYYTTDKIWFYGALPKGPKRGRVRVHFAYDALKGWKRDEWHHLAFSWIKGRYARLYVDGELTNSVEGEFYFPKSMAGITFGPGTGGMGGKVQSLMWDLYVSPYPLPDSQIRLFARSRSQAAPSAEVASDASVLPFGVVQSPPEADGRIEDGEYPVAISEMIDAGTHAAYPDQARFCSAADKASLYLAASLRLPAGHEPRSLATVRDDPRQIAKGDLFCLFLRKDTDVQQKVFEGLYVTVAPNGNVYDAHEEINWASPRCVRKAEADAALDVASAVKDGIWTVELRVPREHAGSTSSFCFSAGFKVGSQRIVLKDHPIWFDHSQAFSQGTVAPLTLTLDLGKLSQGCVDLSCALRTSGKDAVAGRASLRIAIPEIREKAEGMVVDEKIGQKVQVASRRTLHEWAQPFRLTSGATVDLTHTFRLDEPETYLLQTRVETAGTVVFERSLPFVYFPALDVELKPIPSRDQIKAVVSLFGIDLSEILPKDDASPGARAASPAHQPLPKTRSARGKLPALQKSAPSLDKDEGNHGPLPRLELRFRSAETSKEALAQTLPVTQRRQTHAFSMERLPPGVYQVKASLLDRHGERRSTRTLSFEKWPRPAWLANRKGLAALEPDWVPSPWTPVTREANRVAVWGREFTFDEECLLSKLTSQQEALLASPVTIAFEQDDRIHRFRIDAPTFPSGARGLVTAKQTGRAPGFSLTARHQIEFDGMDRIDIRVAPEGEQQVDRLWIEVPFGNVLFSRTWAASSWHGGLARDFESTSLPHVWVGNDRVGCALFAENCKGWLVSSKKPRVTVRVKGRTATLRLLIVNEPAEVRSPLTCTFGLHPTPVKPLFPNWRAIRPQGWGWTKPPTNLFMVGPTLWMSCYSKPAPRSWQVARDLVAHARKHGQTVYPYLTPFTISTYDMVKRDLPFMWTRFPKDALIFKARDAMRTEEYFYFAEDWDLSPPQYNSDGSGRDTTQMVSCSPSSSWTDYFVGSVHEILSRTDIDGFYFDLASPRPNFDASKGYCYTTKDGVQEGTMEYFAARDFYKRLYCVFEELRGPARKPYILGHGSPCHFPLASFWDLNFHGEALKPKKPFEFTQWNLQKRLEGHPITPTAQPDAERSSDAFAYRASQGAQFGLPIMLLPQYGYVRELYRKEHAREMLSWTFLHNNLLWPAYVPAGPVYECWRKVEIPFGMGDAEFHPYWDNDLQCQPNTVRASYWSKPGEQDYLLAVANWSAKVQRATIALPPCFRPFRQCRDLESSVAIPVQKSVEITVPPHDLRMLRFCE